ncbi:MAG TPA: nitroreductase/quinone reductase family protein [Candidatus Limnocylindrales bacterium]|nr:nitroreductase/quinone reductase family protein [Candidatus Limnocylindrales bacterium]
MQVSEGELGWNAKIIENFREHGGRVTMPPFQDSHLLLLTTIGATSGKPTTVPLGYTRDGDAYVVVGSNSGGPLQPVWLGNVLAQPLVSIEVGPETFQARATVTEGALRRRLLDAHQAAIPIFTKYEQMTERQLPVITLERVTPA